MPKTVDSTPKLSSFWSGENTAPSSAAFIGDSSLYLWTCERGHSWESTVTRVYRAKNPCPYCDYRVSIPGETGIFDTHPHLRDRLSDSEDAGEIELLTHRSTRTVEWVCPVGHIYLKKINREARGVENLRQCPICSGRILVANVNSLEAVYPEISNDWDYERNLTVLDIDGPQSVTSKSTRAVYWKCNKCLSTDFIGIHNRIRIGCGYCSAMKTNKNKVLTGFNDFASQYAGAEFLWDYEQNLETPEEIPAKSKFYFWFICRSCGASDKKTPYSIIKSETSCAYCTNRALLVGFNDFGTLFPSLAKEWCIDNPTSPEGHLVAYKGECIQWECVKGHRWSTSIATRVKGSGCPMCSSGKSKPEFEVLEFVINDLDCIAINRDRSIIAPHELDITIPDLKLAIEVNGDYWHSDKFLRENRGLTAVEYHNFKINFCKSVGYELAFVWENDWKDSRKAVETALQNFIKTRSLAQILTRLTSIRD